MYLFSLDRGLNRIGQGKTRFFKNPVKDLKPKKRLITAAFSLPLQTLHENRPLTDAHRPDEDFGFNPAKKTNKTSVKLTSTLLAPKKDRKVRNTKRIISDENSKSTKSQNVKPTQVSSLRLSMTPKNTQKSAKKTIAGKGIINVKFFL
mgnify:CR=1 FL=1